MQPSFPIVAIIGRPNVGKSSLFNRLAKEDRAIVSDISGTTRNIVQKHITPNRGAPFMLIDTAGILEGEKKYAEGDEKIIDAQVQEQVRLILEEATLILFVVDASHGVHPADREAASLLHKGGKNVMFIMNKCDYGGQEAHSFDFAALGFGMPIPVSASHKKGIDSLMRDIVKTLKGMGFVEKTLDEEDSEEEIAHRLKDGIRVAIIGTPNVGKSALLNTLLGKKVAVVSEIAGTTRDMLDTQLTYNEKKYTIIDTAGIRRRGKIERGIETWSIMRTMGAVARADVVVIVIDSQRGVAKQDMHVMEAALDAKKGVILLVNKWDVIKFVDDLPEELQTFRLQTEDLMAQYMTYMKWKLPFLPWAPVLFVSAHSGRNVEQVFGLIDSCYAARETRIETGKLNSFVRMIAEQHKPSGTKAVIPKISYVTQVSVSPPHFVFFVNKKEAFHFSYLRYLENKIRDKWEFFGTPIVIEMRNKPKIDFNDEAHAKKKKYGYNQYHAD